MTATVLIIASVVLATMASIVGWYFTWLYAHENWRSTEAGRHLMYFTAGMSVIMTWSVAGIILRLWLGTPHWLELFLAYGRTITFGWAAFMLVQRTRLLRKAIRQRKEDANARLQ